MGERKGEARARLDLTAIWFGYAAGTFLWTLVALSDGQLFPGDFLAMLGGAVGNLGAVIFALRYAKAA